MAQSSLSLYQIEEELAALLDTADLVESEDQRLAILDDIAERTAGAVEKRDKVIRFLRHLEFQIAAAAEEEERISDLRNSWQKGKERLEKYVIGIIERFAPDPKRGPKKLEGKYGVLSLAQNPDSVQITNGEAVPAEFKDVTIRLSGTEYETLLSRLEKAELFEEGVLLASRSQSTARKTEIKRALAGGVEVPGADLKFGAMRLAIR